MRYFRYIIGILLGFFLLAGSALAAGTLQLGVNPKVGSYVVVSGDCGSASAGGTATFNLSQNGSTVILAAVGTKVAANGSLTATVGIPRSFTGGSAILTATCPNNTVLSTVVVLEPTLPDGTIVKGSTKTVFIIFSGQKYGIPTEEIFYRLGLSFSDLVYLSDGEINNYPDGSIIF